MHIICFAESIVRL